MMLAQLWIAGTALAGRFADAKAVRVIEKEPAVPLLIRVAPPSAAAPRVDEPVLPPLPKPPEADPEISPTPLAIPPVADARAESLIGGAREARVAGDMVKAIVKLEEALERAPEDPQLLFELGLVHEQMGVFDKAAENYQKVFNLGTTGAGALYAQAAQKIRDGFQNPELAMVGKMSLGRVRIFKDSENTEGERVVLTIPVQKAPGEDVDPTKVEVSVQFFNKTNKGEILQLDEQSKGWVRDQWPSEPVDWQQGDESLRMIYQIPKQDDGQERLFGGRSYYGQAVVLKYDGRILDVQAWPRELAARINQPRELPGPSQENGLLPEFQDSLPADFDPDLGLLPSKLPE